MSDFIPLKIPFDYRPARFAHPSSNGFWVRFYFVFDGKHVYTFTNSIDSIENGSLLNEMSGPGSCTLFHKDILVTSSQHSDIYNEIISFENLKNKCV